MPRLPRIQVEGAVYYVTSKAMQNEEIFKDKEDYAMYLELVTKYKSQHRFKLYSYCLLPNRLELLIETGDDATISEIMHDLNSLYTKYYNGRYNKHGHLFESRFRSILVEKVQYLLAATRHVNRAPWRHEKTYLSSAQEYPYSSFLVYLHPERASVSGSPDVSEEVKEVLDFLKKKDDGLSYEKYVLEGDKKEIEFLEKNLRRGQILGSDAFRANVHNRVQEHTLELKKENKGKPSPTLLFFIGGFVIVATATSSYLFISKTKLESRYQNLLKTKEVEFSQKARFENTSPLTLTELDGTRWAIEVVPAPRGGVIQKDQLSFKEGLFQCESLKARGFSSANYVLIPQGGRVVRWETTQTNPAGEKAVWSGTWQGDAMKGSLKLEDKTGEHTYLFFSAKWSIL